MQRANQSFKEYERVELTISPRPNMEKLPVLCMLKQKKGDGWGDDQVRSKRDLMMTHLGKTSLPGSDSFGASRTNPDRCSFLAKTPTWGGQMEQPWGMQFPIVQVSWDWTSCWYNRYWLDYQQAVWLLWPWHSCWICRTRRKPRQKRTNMCRMGKNRSKFQHQTSCMSKNFICYYQILLLKKGWKGGSNEGRKKRKEVILKSGRKWRLKEKKDKKLLPRKHHRLIIRPKGGWTLWGLAAAQEQWRQHRGPFQELKKRW